MCDLSMTVFTDWKFEGAYAHSYWREILHKINVTCELVCRRCIILCAVILGRPQCDCMVRNSFHVLYNTIFSPGVNFRYFREF